MSLIGEIPLSPLSLSLSHWIPAFFGHSGADLLKPAMRNKFRPTFRRIQQREQKGDEKPQQQKKRKNNNPFVFPEKKIPAVDKTPRDRERCVILPRKNARLMKRSSRRPRDAMYYITFQAKKDGKAYSPCNFQALVRNSGRMHIEFCREEKKPKLTEGPGRHLSNDERLTSL